METHNDYDLGPEEIRALEETWLFSTYKRSNLYCAHGEGAYVRDLAGRRYLDFLAGISVNSLGYNHPRIVGALRDQGGRLIHCSNLFYNPFQGLLARKLAALAGMERVFFTNSGAEAMEAALKIARAYGSARGKGDKSRILTLRNSFHGRTLGALSITTQEKYQAPFRPLIPDIGVVEALTPDALAGAFCDRVCALVVEPVQGEGGVFPMPADFMQAARELCDRHDALLVADEIQCGMGRTGKFFGFEHYGIRPDVVTVAKSLAAGYPLGAVLGNGRVAGSLGPGDHGTTFGGGPLACRVALEVLAVIEEEGLIRNVREMGDYLAEGLRSLARRHPLMGEIRALGLMIGVELGASARETVDRLLEKGVIANAAHETVLRLLPPFVITRKECDLFLETLDGVLGGIEEEQPRPS
ncbi:MAG: aspartate aminotransferase family protein [Acidobacteria bacterium]|jgi:predicted acetylornithine/succinylornithine family transaminase|nr:aspartate aminotransferase family protein [Acidobacteriota bacterium]